MYGVVIGFIIANKEIGIMWITDIVVRLIPDSVYCTGESWGKN